MPRLATTALTALFAAGMTAGAAGAAELEKVGISVGSLGNPFFVALAEGATDRAREVNPDVEVLTVGYDYDLNKQFTQIDNFIAAGVQLILLNPGDPNAIEPAIRRAQKAGIEVVAVDTAAEGADATITTDNVQAGEIACQHIVDSLDGEGNVIIQNGPQVSAVVDRVAGCRKAFEAAPGITILSDDQDGKGSRDGGMSVAQAQLTRFSDVDAIFTINDPQALGAELAAKQLGRTDIIITSVDGAPDIEAALARDDTLIKASAAQDPYRMAQEAMEIGLKLLDGSAPDAPVTLIPAELITEDNVADYQGWTADR